MQTSGDQRREIAKLYPPVIASDSEAIHSTGIAKEWIASLRSQ